jgi:hypothetical protein
VPVAANAAAAAIPSSSGTITISSATATIGHAADTTTRGRTVWREAGSGQVGIGGCSNPM